MIKLNQAAFEQFTCEKQIWVRRGGGHFIEEPGALDMLTAANSGLLRGPPHRLEEAA